MYSTRYGEYVCTTIVDIAALRDTWDVLVSRLSRIDPQSGDLIEGVFELQGALGSHVTSVADLATAHAKSQHNLGTLCMRAVDRNWREDASVQDCVRLTECGGKEAGWVDRCPTRPEYCMSNRLWRTAVLVRLALPLPHLRKQQHGCECHDRHDARTRSRVRKRRRPRHVDCKGEHDQRCPLTFTLGRHDEVQERALRPLIKEAGIHVETSKVRELRRVDDPNDNSKRKGDLTATGLFHDGQTVLDVGITHPTIDTYINNSSSGAARGSAANIYANNKCRSANKIIKDKELDLDFMAITFTTFGGFGKATHDLIKKLTSEAYDYDFDPWARPSPKSHAYLSLGFALARANARMLINADSKRRSARNRVRTSRQRSATPDSESV